MTINLKFDKKDFQDMRTFEASIKRQLGPHVYVGTDNLCFFFYYPPALVNQLRPFSKETQLEFELQSTTPQPGATTKGKQT